MKNLLILLFSVLVFISFPAFGVTGDCEVFMKKNDVTKCFQSKSIKGKVIKSVTLFVYFGKDQTGHNGKEIRSVRIIQNYDCAGSLVRLENAINFA